MPLDGNVNFDSGFVPSGEAPTEDVERELARAISLKGDQTFSANMVGFFLCLIAAGLLPFSAMLGVALALRALSIYATAVLSRKTYEDIKAKRGYQKHLKALKFSLAISGTTWALLLWPVLISDTISSGALVLSLTVMAGVTKVASVIGVFPKALFGFVGTVAATILLQLAMITATFEIWVPVVTLAFVVAMILFSMNVAGQQIESARMLVRNKMLGEELASALHHAEHLARHDPLTGLLNRRALFEQNALETEHHDLWLILIDLDHFKLVNDQHGHETGDNVLIACAGVLRQFLRELPEGPHRAIRLGGEEFLLVLQGIQAPAMQSLASAVCARISELEHPGSIDGHRVSASVGVAKWTKGTSLDQALGAADAALYKAKENGRNRVEVHPDIVANAAA